MSLTIDLTPELETHLRDEAAKVGLTPNRYVVETLKAQIDRSRDDQSTPHLSKSESELMLRINKGLPEETWHQYHDLTAKCRAETLTSEQHETLLKLTDQVEMDYAQRLGLIWNWRTCAERL